MNRKGQALVEFIIILPIFLLLVLGIVDLGKILYNKTILEGAITDVISMYESGKSSQEILSNLDMDELDLEIDEDEKITFHLIKEIDIITPGLNLLIENPYVIDVHRSISYE